MSRPQGEVWQLSCHLAETPPRLRRQQGFYAIRVHFDVVSALPCPLKPDEGGSFASAAAISCQDGARQACHAAPKGEPVRITSPSALHLASARSEPAPANVSNCWWVLTSHRM